MPDVTQPPKKRGRPPATTIEALQETALAVINRVGYERATLETIAAEAGVSTRTLHRYFATKADIVWSGTEQSAVILRDGFARISNEIPTTEALVCVTRDALAARPAITMMIRDHLRLIAVTPELRAMRPELFHEWHAEFSRFVADRRGESPDDLVPRVIATATQEALMSALAWWATSDTNLPPSEVVVEALEHLFGLRGDSLRSAHTPPG